MNLTIEQMRKIVDGAPEGSEMWRDMDSVCSPGEVLYYWWFGGDLLVHDAEKGWVKSIYHDGNDYILDQLELLSDLKSEIDHHYYGRSEAEELAAYAELSQEKIEGGAMLVGDFSKAQERIQSVFEDDRTDYVSDIRNHISPMTIVQGDL